MCSRLFTFLLLFPVLSIAGNNPQSIEVALKTEIAAGNVIHRITTIDEFKTLFGSPAKEETSPDGDSHFTLLTYPGDIFAGFKEMGAKVNEKKENKVFALTGIGIAGKLIELPKPVLRNIDDLKRMNFHSGLSGVSLRKLDLRGQKERFLHLSFDTHTEWPATDKMPADFDPVRIMEEGKNPGLGVRQLHDKGIDGRGVGIAIIDQVLLLGHIEYTGSLVYYNATSLPDKVKPQMHGAAVAGFAVGKTLGTAPAATLYYFAFLTSSSNNNYYVEGLKTILELNKNLPDNAKIRVVSISDGHMAQQKDFAKWQAAFRQAEDNNIMVLTCEAGNIGFGTLKRRINANPDSPESYEAADWDTVSHQLWVPGGNQTRASYEHTDGYIFDTIGGRSWSTPYLAGIAAMGFQINPALTPAKIRKLLLKSATRKKDGLTIVNPKSFIALVKQTVKK